MYYLSCGIEIETTEGTVRLRWCESVTIQKLVEKLCDTCTVTLPRRLRWSNVQKNPIRRGDRIRIKLGYNGDNRLAFVGRVRAIKPGIPMTIECQDEMCLYQTQKAVKMAYPQADLQTMLHDQGIEAVINGRQTLGSYRVECNTVAELLSALGGQGIRAMYRIGAGDNPVMYAGLGIRPTDARKFNFDDHQNLVSRAELNYTPADSVRFLVRVKNLSTNGAKCVKKVEVGDTDGELRTFNVINMDENQMKTYAEQQMKQLQQGGLSGSLVAFGSEIVDKHDSVCLRLDDVNVGRYDVMGNEIRWGADGFRQKITIGTKL